jgi:hypothetical protein
MNTLSARDMRNILTHLDDIKELTDLLRRAHFEVPYKAVYGAAGGEAAIRELLIGAAITEITIEPASEARDGRMQPIGDVIERIVERMQP